MISTLMWVNSIGEWDFTGQNIAGASFGASTLKGFTKEQFYSTSSYQNKDLRGVALGYNELQGWDFSGQDLTGASFSFATLTDTNFEGAILIGANFNTPRFATGVNVKGANLKSTAVTFSMSDALYDENTVYDQYTIFGSFDPEAAGLKFEPTEEGDFNADGVLDAADVDVYYRFFPHFLRPGSPSIG